MGFQSGPPFRGGMLFSCGVGEAGVSVLQKVRERERSESVRMRFCPGNTRGLHQRLLDHLAGVVGEALVAAVVPERQLQVVESEQV